MMTFLSLLTSSGNKIKVFVFTFPIPSVFCHLAAHFLVRVLTIIISLE